MRFGFREFIFLIVLLSVPIVSLFYVFKPRNEDIKLALQEIAYKRTQLDALSVVNDQRTDLGLELEKLEAMIAKVEAKLPSKEDVEVILEQVWQITESNSLTVKSVKTDKSVPAAMYREQPLEMKVEGTFDGFYEFLLGVEKLERITRIHELKITRSRGGGRSGNAPGGSMRAEFTLSIYFEPSGRKAG